MTILIARRIATTALAILLSACSGGNGNQGSGSTQSSDSAPANDAGPVTYASLTGDAARGKAKFAQCAACHALEAGKNGLGPSLHNVIGHPAGQVPAFVYSPAMKASQRVWDEPTLYLYLENPRKVIPGTKMSYAGMRDSQARADVIAYIKANDWAR